MEFSQTLIAGTFIKRSKRFLADIILQNGKHIIAHCPNSGTMKSCLQQGWEVRLSCHDGKNRKLPYTLEMIHNGKCWIGINTMIPNRITEESIKAEKIKEISGYTEIRREQRYGKNSRIDLLLKKEKETCFIEVKNVTLLEGDGCYYFPDAVTERGRRHLTELMTMVHEGHRAVVLFIVQRKDGSIFKPAVHIDPVFARTLSESYQNGVEILVYRAEVNPEKIEIVESVPWNLGHQLQELSS
jgi:sugar fermentation stimulation protein A